MIRFKRVSPTKETFMKTVLALGFSIFYASTSYAAGLRGNCEVLAMKSSLEVQETIGEMRLAYPRTARLGTSALLRNSGAYIGCSFDNRFNPLQFSCGVSEGGKKVLDVALPVSEGSMRFYGNLVSGKKIEINCEITAID